MVNNGVKTVFSVNGTRTTGHPSMFKKKKKTRQLF